MAFSTFVFDTLDVSTRLGRYVLQELFNARKAPWVGPLATALTLGPPAYFIATATPPGPGVRPAYMNFWTLFGTSNQLLASLTLLAITVWLYREKRRIWYTAIPTVFVMVVTVWALVAQIRHAFASLKDGGFVLNTTTMNGVVGIALVGLAAALLFEAARVVLGKAPTPEPTQAG
jgi:carbon starvation protein